MPVPKHASELDDLLLRVDYASATINYYGHAACGSLQASPVWRIRRETLDGDGRTTVIEYADGNGSFDNSWSNRASIDYS